MPAGMNPPYRVVFSEAVRKQLQDLCDRASQHGRRKSVLAAARAIVSRLRSEPLRFGEHLYTLRGMKLKVRDGVVPPLLVRYGVRAKERLVFVQTFLVLPGSGF